MNKNQSLLILAIKGIVYIYIPVILLFYFIFEVMLRKDLALPFDIVIIYAVVVVIWTTRYRHKSMEEEVEDFSTLESLIKKTRWKFIEQGENRLLVKPKYDFPFRTFLGNTVEIQYSNHKATIEGPWYYVNDLAKDIRGESEILIKTVTGIVSLMIVLGIVSIVFLNEKGLIWDIMKIQHNYQVKNVEIIEIKPEEVHGNTIENTNNYGFGVENEDYIFYVKNNLNLVRVDKDFNDKIFLIQKTSGTGISRLNIAGDWIYYSSGRTLNRMRIDGTDNKTIYKLSYPLDIHMKDNWIYFINHSDDFNVYRMDINGRNFGRFLRVHASDIALYEGRLFFSHTEGDNSYVESISLDGSDRKVELNVLAKDLTKWRGSYYYIGDDYRLYMNSTNGNTTPQLLVDAAVSSYIITETGIFYSLHSNDVGYPGEGIYKVLFDGTGNTLIMDTNEVAGLTKIGEWLLFHSSDNKSYPSLKRLNIYEGIVETLE